MTRHTQRTGALLGGVGACAIGAGLLAGVTTCPPVQALEGPVDLVLGADVRIDGGSTGEKAGWSVAPAGDVNADGRPDMVIGAYNAAYNSRPGSGAAYVVFGGALPRVLDLADLGTHGFRIDGATGGAGFHVAGAGDVNDDGKADVIVGAPWATVNAQVQAGAAYVVFGSTSTATVDLADLAFRGFRIDGALANDSAGWSVAGAGDMNADGMDDVLVSAPWADRNSRTNSGSAYVVYGKSTSSIVSLSALGTYGFRIDGAAAGDVTGFAVEGPAHVNGDAVPDLIIHSPQAKNGRTGSGSVYVVFGSATPGDRDLATLGATGYRIDGPVANASMALAAVLGDINGDGRDDLALADQATVHVVAGTASTTTIDLATPGAAVFRVLGGARQVAAAGDFDGNGRDDMLAGNGAAGANGRTNSGAAYVIYGNEDVDLAALGASQGVRFDGAAAQDGLSQVAGVGDVNGDGGDDILLAAPEADNNGRAGSGAAYLVHGTPPVGPPPVGPPTEPPASPTPAGSLTVKARAARKAVPRKGRVVLVRKVIVGPRQSAQITVKASKRVKVIKTATSVAVRTKHAPTGTVRVRIVATGTGVTPTVWSRTWKVR